MRKLLQKGVVTEMNDYDKIEGDEWTLRYILEKKIYDAMSLRRALNLPSPGITDTYRLVNGEGDGLSGLAVDIIGGNVAIIMSSAAWCEIHKSTVISALEKSLERHPSYQAIRVEIVWRNTPSRLNQDGYNLAELEISADHATSVVAMESSVRYLTYPFSEGQKTGFYCDQRDNRLMLAKFCENKTVLDLCCYNGGFALNAIIRGNAASALGIDSSQVAVDAAVANAELNGLSQKDISFIREDIAVFMKNAIESNVEYDVVILDPPKLAPTQSSLPKASRKYHK